MPSFQRSRLPGLLFNVIALATSIASFARAQITTVETAPAAPTQTVVALDKYVVSASRTPQDPRYTPSAVTVIKFDELGSSQVSDLRMALAAQPGVAVVASGAMGGQTSIFMRGAASDQVLLFVDGVRMNTTEAGYANFLGGADLVGIDRLEVLRGPQSTLYGSSAMGGVITLDTTHGCGAPTGTVMLTTGSFDTFSASAVAQGGTRNFGYSASLARMRTDNDRPDNTYRQTSYSTRLEVVATPGLLLGATLRGQQGRYEEPGSATSNHGEVEAPNHLVTTYAQWSQGSVFCSRLTGAWHQTEYQWTDKTYGPSADFYTRSTRRILDWQNSWIATSWAQLVAGVNAEWADFVSGSTRLNADQKGLYASASFHPVAGLTLDIGGRSDDHNLEGRANTWRSGASYFIKATGTKLRATYGTGFKTPSMINRFGSSPWYGPSATVMPEKSKGWDAGFDQELLAGRLAASTTYFHNDFRDLIVSSYTYPPGKYIAKNVNKAYTEGGEFALTVQPIQFLKLRAAYTYLSAINNSNDANPVRLVRRPRHFGDVELQVLPTSGWVFGTGLHFVGSREDTVFDPMTYASRQVDVEDYAVARAFVSYQAGADFAVKLRVENALSETYVEAVGYESLPRGIFASIEMKF